MATGIVACVLLLLGALYLQHRKQLTLWRGEAEQVQRELTPERNHALAAFQHYLEFKPLPEDQQWMSSHGLVEPGRKDKVMLSSKGLYILRLMGFNVY